MKNRILDCRMEKGIASQAELARKSGVTRAAISALETGLSKNLNGHTLIALADVLGVNEKWLLTGQGSKYKNDTSHNTPNCKKTTEFLAKVSVTSQYSDIAKEYQTSEIIITRIIK